ncbi:lytic transglycosylase, partial [Streptomyces purpureus]
MSAFTPGNRRLKKAHKVSIAAVAAAGAAAVTLSLVPGSASADTETKALASTQVAWAANTGTAQNSVTESLTQQHDAVSRMARAEADAKVEAAAKAKAAAQAKAKAAAKAKAVAKAKADAKKRAAAKAAASRAAVRKPVYPNNLDGWIREALDIMKKHKIPGSYEGIHRNIMRESSGNPNAINN